MTFAEATQAIAQGKLVRRPDWNKGVWLRLYGHKIGYFHEEDPTGAWHIKVCLEDPFFSFADTQTDDWEIREALDNPEAVNTTTGGLLRICTTSCPLVVTDTKKGETQ